MSDESGGGYSSFPADSLPAKIENSNIPHGMPRFVMGWFGRVFVLEIQRIYKLQLYWDS